MKNRIDNYRGLDPVVAVSQPILLNGEPVEVVQESPPVSLKGSLIIDMVIYDAA